jgi:hypothetical protein
MPTGSALHLFPIDDSTRCAISLTHSKILKGGGIRQNLDGFLQRFVFRHRHDDGRGTTVAGHNHVIVEVLDIVQQRG